MWLISLNDVFIYMYLMMIIAKYDAKWWSGGPPTNWPFNGHVSHAGLGNSPLCHRPLGNRDDSPPPNQPCTDRWGPASWKAWRNWWPAMLKLPWVELDPNTPKTNRWMSRNTPFISILCCSWNVRAQGFQLPSLLVCIFCLLTAPSHRCMLGLLMLASTDSHSGDTSRAEEYAWNSRRNCYVTCQKLEILSHSTMAQWPLP